MRSVRRTLASAVDSAASEHAVESDGPPESSRQTATQPALGPTLAHGPSPRRLGHQMFTLQGPGEPDRAASCRPRPASKVPTVWCMVRGAWRRRRWVPGTARGCPPALCRGQRQRLHRVRAPSWVPGERRVLRGTAGLPASGTTYTISRSPFRSQRSSAGSGLLQARRADARTASLPPPPRRLRRPPVCQAVVARSQDQR